MGVCASKPPSSSTAATDADDGASPWSETRATDRDAPSPVSTGRRRDGVSASTCERVGVIVVDDGDEGNDDGSSSSGSSVDERVVRRQARDVDEDAAAAAARETTTTANATTPAKATRVEAMEDVDASADRVVSSKRPASASTSETWVRVGETRMTTSPVESEAAARRRRSESEDDKATIEALRRALADKLPSSSTSQKAPDGSVLMASAVRPSASVARRARDRGEQPYRGETKTTTTSANRPSRRRRDEEFLERNRSDDEDAERRRRSAQKPPTNKDDVEKRARRQLRKQARDDVEREMEIKTAVRARVEEKERQQDGTDADAGESPLVSVVTPRSSLKIKVPTTPSAADLKPRRSGAERYGKSPRNSYNSKLDELLAVAERAGSTAERVRDQITDLEQRVELNNLKPIAVQPWQEHGNAWAGDRHSKGDRHSRHSKSARSERSSSAGTILNPKNKNSREMRVKYEHARSDGSNSTPTTPEKPKIITSVLRSDLVKSMGEMSADEKLKRLGLKSVPENDDATSPTNSNPWASVPRRPSPARREWRERMSPAQAPRSTYSGDDGENGFSPPPPSVGSHRDNGAELPANYLDKLKAQAKLARSESAKSWKPGVGVQIGRAL